MDMVSVAIGASIGMAAAAGVGRLAEHRTSPAGVADLLNWGFLVNDGVILQKDGSLLAGWSYRGPDLGAATPDQLDQLAQHLNDALLPLADSWMFHIDAVRHAATAYPASTFPNVITALIDEERRNAYATEGQHYETDYVLTVTYLPPAEVFSRLGRWFVRGESTRGVDWNQTLGTFAAALQALEHRLSTHLTLERLGSNALLRHLHRCLTGLGHPVGMPPHGAYLNTVLADQELVGGFEPRIGELAIRAIAVQGYPSASRIGQLDCLTTLPFSYRWSTRVLPIGQSAAAKLIRRHQLTWFKKRKGMSDWLRDMTTSQPARRDNEEAAFLNQDAQRLVKDAGDALTENATNRVRFCFTTQVILVMEPEASRADAVAREMVKTLHDAGLAARVETVNALEAYLGTLPGHGYPNVRRPLLSTANIVDLLPVTSVWPGLATNPSSFFPPASPPLLWAKTDGTTPFRLNLHHEDVGHTLIVGRTGAGKSTLVGLITAQFQRYANAQVFVFDVGYSAWALAQAAGAQHYDLASGSVDALTFQPLARIDDPAERTWAAEWLELLCTLQGVTITPPLRAKIDGALRLVAQNPPEHRTLTELTVHLQHRDLVAALRPYTVTGTYGRLLDATEDALLEGRYQVFELKHLMEMDDKILVPTALYLFHRMERRLDGSPTLMVFEELWAALMRSVFADRIKQWLLTLRKQNAAVVLVAHSVGQLAEAPNRHALLESCPTRIFLPNPDAMARETAKLYGDLGLNSREVEMIARAVPKRHYYFASPRGRRLFELGLGPVALSFLSTPNGLTTEDARREIGALIARHGADWPAPWLYRAGLTSWSSRFTQLSHDSHPEDSHASAS